MAEPVLLLKLTKIQYDDGTEVMVELKPDMADAIRMLDERLRKRETRRKKQEKTFSEMGINPRDLASPWQGPRLSFAWLIGESRTWPGPPTPKAGAKCDFCQGRKLPLYAYCLRCDRCGRDLLIPRPSKVELARIRAPKDDGLKGGK